MSSKYRIIDLDKESYFGEGAVFDSPEECEEQLKSFHSTDVEGIEEMSLREICRAFNWVIEEESETVSLLGKFA